MNSNNQNTQQNNSITMDKDISISSEMEIKPITGFQQLTKAIGVQANLQNLLPQDMYSKISALEKSQREHEILFGRLTSIIDELSERYNGGNFSPDRISSEGYASKNTTTSVEDTFEVSSNGESLISIDSIKIEHDDVDDNSNDNHSNDEDVEDSINVIENHTSETEDEDISIRKSQRIIRPRIYSDMIYDSFSDDKQSMKSDEDKSFNTTISTIDDTEITMHDSIPTSTSDENNHNMIQLGPHGTMIDIIEYNSILWESPSTATRKLLGCIFDMETLATHSLTGRPSPAFFGRERPLKNQLDPEKIADIIHAVITKSNATERDIRAAITTKCADTSKMYKIKQTRMKKLYSLK